MKTLFAGAAAAVATVLIAGTASAQIVLPSGQVGENYATTLPSPPGYTSAIQSTASAPPGLSVVGGMTLTGTPTAAGTYDFSVNVSGFVADTCMMPGMFPPYTPTPTPCSQPSSTTQTYRLQVVAAPAAVPTMSEWAMILLGLALAGGAALTIQRRRTA